jgi:hypothetical protein
MAWKIEGADYDRCEVLLAFNVQSGEVDGVVSHPAGSTLTIAKSARGRISAFWLEFDNSGRSAFSAPVAWAG